MEGGKEMHMEMIELSMQKERFESLINSGVLSFDEVNIKFIEPKDFDYSKDPVWVALNNESLKVYKKKKEREFEIRNGL